MLTPIYEDRAIWYANRQVLVLRPLDLFVDWVGHLEAPDAPAPRGGGAPDAAATFLIPLFEHEDDIEVWLEENCDLLFETTLWIWSPEEALWPMERSWDVFREWFEAEVLEAPWDVVAAPLHSDPPPPEGDWH